ncbi:putative carboxylesterase 17 [Platanthera zijinensis]|uniref:Carboxylesterase 17 n=1 Tax=Platanthera zijinensis TaxID=2320716 RepID=A0AAP0B040_9ASPA
MRGVILVQPFFGGEARTASERSLRESAAKSALSLSAAECYWRLALPAGCDRDSVWCNPVGEEGLKKMERPASMPGMLVCVAEMDILRDRNLEFCGALKGAGKKVELEMYEGVGHAFHVLQSYYDLSQNRTNDLISDVTKFITNI